MLLFWLLSILSLKSKLKKKKNSTILQIGNIIGLNKIKTKRKPIYADIEKETLEKNIIKLKNFIRGN